MTKTIAVSAAGRPVGEDSARCRWPDAVVEEIRQRVAAGETVTAAAARFGVPFGTAWISSDAAAGPCCRPAGDRPRGRRVSVG
ncbi:MAG: hypothetical protein ACLTS9_10650 [Sutterella wadsworthensis]